MTKKNRRTKNGNQLFNGSYNKYFSIKINIKLPIRKKSILKQKTVRF